MKLKQWLAGSRVPCQSHLANTTRTDTRLPLPDNYEGELPLYELPRPKLPLHELPPPKRL